MYSRFRTAAVNARHNSASSDSKLQQQNRINSGCITRSRAQQMATLANPYVEHDAVNSEFFINIGNNKAFISYKLDGSVMHMEHTDVPIAFEGRGVGKQLAKVIESELRFETNNNCMLSFLDRYSIAIMLNVHHTFTFSFNFHFFFVFFSVRL